MKRYLTIAFLILPVLFACTEASDKGSEVATSVVLSKDKVDLLVGESATITATVLPSSLGMGVNWSVLDETYASVSGGTITAKAEGVTYVVAVSADGNQRAACMVSVNPPARYKVNVTDEYGKDATFIYGYPGMEKKLSVSTSDGESHQFTWSVESPSAADIDDGSIVLGAVKSSDPAYIYDAQSKFKVVTEDGCFGEVGFRSSLLDGVMFDGGYYEAGEIIPVYEGSSYPLSFLYENGSLRSAVPADAINVEVSDKLHFFIQKLNGAYSLVTGTADEEYTASLSIKLPGQGDKKELVQFKIDKSSPIRARCVGTSSSTLSFAWTEGGTASDDASKPYTITLYTDEACSDALLSYSIPANHSCWNKRQPRFVFSGLDSGTKYWFKVVDTEDAENYLESAPVSGTTDSFTIVEPSNTPAAIGDIILAEDFSELCWFADEVTQAAGCGVNSSAPTFQYRDNTLFYGTTGKHNSAGNSGIIGLQTTAKKVPGLRLGNWAPGFSYRLYVGPGYVFISHHDYQSHLITPALENIPENQSAKIEVTIHAAGYAEGGQAVIAVQHGQPISNNISSTGTANKNGFDLETNKALITYTGGLTSLKEFTVTLDGVEKGDRIAFGPTSGTDAYVVSDTNMMLISDMTVKIIELN